MREFQEKFRIPEGVDVTKLSSEISGDGVLIITGQKREYLICYQRKVIIMINNIISGPQSGDLVTDEGHKGDTDSKSSSEAKKTSTESNFVTEGGVGTTRKNEVSVELTHDGPTDVQYFTHKASNKTRSESVTRRVTEDGWEEEVYEEYEEEEVRVKSTTLVTAADSEERERVAGGVTSKQTVESATSDQSSR